VESGDRIVVLATGSGLKDVAAAIQSVGQPPIVSPDLAQVRDVIHTLRGMPGSTRVSRRREP
jgi:threonine synthase